MQALIKKLTRFSENVSGAILATIFCVFLLQIFSRYILVDPLGWTLEVCLTLWVWLIFWTNAFVLKNDDHVVFDILYYSVREKVRRVFALISAVAIIVAFIISLYPTWDFIDFLKIKKSAYLRAPMRTVFSVYMLFMLAVIIIYLTRAIKIMRGGNLEDSPPHIVPAGNIDERFDDSNKEFSHQEESSCR